MCAKIIFFDEIGTLALPYSANSKNIPGSLWQRAFKTLPEICSARFTPGKTFYDFWR
jgi:hypothetical protein